MSEKKSPQPCGRTGEGKEKGSPLYCNTRAGGKAMKNWLKEVDTWLLLDRADACIQWLTEQIAKLTMIGAVFIAPMVLGGALCHVLGV